MTIRASGNPNQPTNTNVQVIAPATLNSGFTFDAEYEGSTFTVTVPEGGVVEGQQFLVLSNPAATEAVTKAVPVQTHNLPAAASSRRRNSSSEANIPTGKWRDNLCDCCRFECCHPTICCAMWCIPLIVAQLLTRMKMTWLGQRTHMWNGNGNETDQRWKGTFLKIMIVMVVYYILKSSLASTPRTNLEAAYPSDATIVTESDEKTVWLSLALVFSRLFEFYFFYLIVQLRATMRHVYSIPEERCLCLYGERNPSDGICCVSRHCCTSGVPVGWEDVCCAFFCPVCVTSQMARHTVDYEYRRAVCCNTVGVSNYEPDEAYAGMESSVRDGEGTTALIV